MSCSLIKENLPKLFSLVLFVAFALCPIDTAHAESQGPVSAFDRLSEGDRTPNYLLDKLELSSPDVATSAKTEDGIIMLMGRPVPILTKGEKPIHKKHYDKDVQERKSKINGVLDEGLFSLHEDF